MKYVDAILIQMESHADSLSLLVCEAKALRISHDQLLRVSQIRSEMEKLKKQLQRDAQLMEFLSLRSKTPYVQFALTKQFRRSAEGTQVGGSNDATASGNGGVTETGAGGGATATGGAVSSFAVATSEAGSLPPM